MMRCQIGDVGIARGKVDLVEFGRFQPRVAVAPRISKIDASKHPELAGCCQHSIGTIWMNRQADHFWHSGKRVLAFLRCDLLKIGNYIPTPSSSSILAVLKTPVGCDPDKIWVAMLDYDGLY